MNTVSYTHLDVYKRQGILAAKKDAEVIVKPLADGGEGTTDALIEGLKGERCLLYTSKYGYGSSVAIMIVIICMVVGMLFRKFTGGGDDG